MTEMAIEMKDGVTGFEPGATVHGRATWLMDGHVESLEARLMWHTVGMGTRDRAVAQTVTFHKPLQQETRSFEMRLPVEPYSCSGKLVSIVWLIELVALPSEENVNQTIVIGPGGKEVDFAGG